MRQHAIPQNILDVEFKLFTKFTVKEFAYIAIGVGFGGIWLLFFSRGDVPGVIAVPIFLVSSIIGLGLAVLPVNNQNADVFLGNFISAIRKPTLRVWRSEQFDEKYQVLAQKRGVNISETTGTMDRDTNIAQQANTRVVGGTAKPIPVNQFDTDETIYELDKEEAIRLAQLEEVAIETMGPQQLPPSEILNDNRQSPPIPQRGNKEIRIDYDKILQKTEVERVEQAVTMNQQNIPEKAEIHNQTTTSNLGQIKNLETEHTPKTKVEALADQDPVTPTQPPTVQQLVVEQKTDNRMNTLDKTNSKQTKKITVDKNNCSKYLTEVEGYKPDVGEISLFLSDINDLGIPQAMVIIKSEQGNIVQALQSDPQGLVVPNKKLPKGTYNIKIEHDNYQFPPITVILEGVALPVINIDSLNVL